MPDAFTPTVIAGLATVSAANVWPAGGGGPRRKPPSQPPPLEPMRRRPRRARRSRRPFGSHGHDARRHPRQRVHDERTRRCGGESMKEGAALLERSHAGHWSNVERTKGAGPGRSAGSSQVQPGSALAFVLSKCGVSRSCLDRRSRRGPSQVHPTQLKRDFPFPAINELTDALALFVSFL